MARPTTLAAITAAALLAASITDARAALSTFDASDEGWTLIDPAGNGDYATVLGTFNASWGASAGNPGGGVFATDPSFNTFFFRAPDAYRGDNSAAAASTLRFDLKTTHDTWTADTVVVIVGNGGQIIAAPIAQPAIDTWQTYSISLVPASFRQNNAAGGAVSDADFAAILADVEELWLPGEFGDGLVETTTIDNVYFPVPTPGAAGLGVIALAGLSRRRR